MSHHLNRLLLVGTGPMAVSYTQVLKALQVEFDVVGRTQKTADQYSSATGKPVTVGFLDSASIDWSKYSHTIVAISTDALACAAHALVKNGIKKVLLEKPGALRLEDLAGLSKEAQSRSAEVQIAYNRRYYSSVGLAKKLIAEDGGVRTLHFDFTELSKIIEKLSKPPGVKENWFFANSTHLVNLAFFLAGQPKDWKSVCRAGSLSWHPRASFFSGCGTTESQALFTYEANWEAPGRWSVELTTDRRRLLLKPLEELQQYDPESRTYRTLALETAADRDFKPGLFKQVEAFIGTANDPLRYTLEDQIRDWKEIYLPILGG